MRSKKAIINVISFVLLQLITIVCGFIIPRIIISTYGSEVNGLITSISQFLAFITLLESGFGPVVKSVLYKPIADKDKSTIERILKTSERFFKKISYVFLVYIVILAIVMPMIISNEFDIIYTASLIIIIAISKFTEYYFGMTYKLYLQAEQKNYIVTAIQILTLILNTVLVIVLIKLSVNIQVVKLVTALVFVLRPIIQNIYVKKKYNINLKNAEGNYKIKQKWDGLAQHIAYVIHNNTDIIILTLCSTMTEVSVYYVYSLIVNSVKNVLSSLTSGMDATFGDMIAKGEKENLNKSFKLYEVVYFSIITIVFSATLFLIIPFVKVYTDGITDANYIRPVFAYLIVIAEFIWSIREPYSILTKSAGHFKETRKGAWIEAIVNIVISLILVWNFGIVGVAIGTLVAMLIRTAEFMYHATKHILIRKLKSIIKYILVILVEVTLIAIFVNIIPRIEVLGYLEWIIQAIIVTFISISVVVLINFIVYKKDIKEIMQFSKKLFKGEKQVG